MLETVIHHTVPDRNVEILAQFRLHMVALKRSPVTIDARLELLGRLARFLGDAQLLDATPVDLQRFQESYSHLSRNSVDIYSRHTVAFYRWAVQFEHIPSDPTGRMVTVTPRRGVPHPVSAQDLRVVLSVAAGPLRLAYVLAAFAGLRCGEICRLRREDITIRAGLPVALIHGKGDKDRLVPLLPEVVAELAAGPARGPLVTRRNGLPYTPDQLSVVSHKFLHELGVETTLHSFRHYFATEVVRMTRDVLLVRDLLGHSSLTTTQVYMQSSLDDAQTRLAGLSATAVSMLAAGPLGDLDQRPRERPRLAV